MAEENQNGKNGNRVSLLQKVKAGMEEDVQSLKTDLPAKAKDQIEGLKDPTKTQVYTSIFRHKHDDTPRNRALGVLSNVFLHLHPAKINRDAVRYSYTPDLGIFSAVTMANGDVLIPESRLRAAMAAAATPVMAGSPRPGAPG